MIVHGSNDTEAVSLMVDGIGDVLEVNGESFEQVPDAWPSEFGELILGAYNLEKQLLLLDADKTLAVVSGGVAAAS